MHPIQHHFGIDGRSSAQVLKGKRGRAARCASEKVWILCRGKQPLFPSIYSISGAPRVFDARWNSSIPEPKTSSRTQAHREASQGLVKLLSSAKGVGRDNGEWLHFGCLGTLNMLERRGCLLLLTVNWLMLETVGSQIDFKTR